MATEPKSAAAFRTIGEVSHATGLAAHILRYWETRFPQLRPVTRAGNRRYYRPEDVALIERIDRLLNREGYTIKGVQQLLARDRGATVAPPPPSPSPSPPSLSPADRTAALRSVRALLARALADD